MAKALIIVESPAKARTISKFLGGDYVVESSIGHVRDLPSRAAEIPAAYKKKPWARMGVNVEKKFQPLYIIPDKKKAQVKKLKELLKSADALYLATDEDREGEAIAWHLVEVLKPKVPVRRMVFHEITERAIQHAIENPREIDMRLVEAQEARRILDRLYGYEVSPLLWIKIKPKLSAGRVQSVATRLVVERERERMVFKSAEYWSVKAQLESGHEDTPVVDAGLVEVNGRRIALTRDLDGLTGKLTENALKDNVLLLDGSAAGAIQSSLEGERFDITDVIQKPFTQKPLAPFITSTLQQEGGRKLRYTAKRTMRVAQRLYENGHITYMRTDSSNLSNEALQAARGQITELFGAEYLPEAPREYKKKVKGAQEAHEAIRPTGEVFRSSESLKGELDEEEWKLYDMIWRRTLASQMNDAKGQRTQVRFAAEIPAAADAAAGQPVAGRAVFTASGKVITFPGFLKVYSQWGDKAEGEESEKNKLLPPVKEGDRLKASDLVASEHNTKPPARYTEVSLVKILEERGIGRPSTYASIIQTVQDRGYVWKKGGALVPTLTAFAVIQLLEKHLGRLVDYEFTARMEDDLDVISNGDKEATPWLSEFYFGTLEEAERETEAELGVAEVGLKAKVAEGGAAVDARSISTVPIGPLPDGDGDVAARVGRYGPYLQVGDTERRAYIQDTLALDELDVTEAVRLLEEAQLANRTLGDYSLTGQPVYLRSGRFGPYIQLGDPELDSKGKIKKGKKPRMASLWPTMEPKTVTLEEAELILSFPKVLGEHPVTGQEVTVQDGRYGPYVSMPGEEEGKLESRGLEGAHEQLQTVTLDEAVVILSQPRVRRAQQAKGPLNVLAESPATKKPIEVRTGRFGPYVTDGQINATIPTSRDPMTVTFDDALELIAAREDRMRAEGVDPRAPADKKATKKKTTKKKTTKKKTTKKKTTKKKATKKKATKKKATKKKVTKKKVVKKKVVKKKAPAEKAPSI